MSLPGENALSPAPRTITQRRASSFDSETRASPSERHIGLVSALSFSGRFSTTVAIAPSRVTVIRSLIIVRCSLSIRGRRQPRQASNRASRRPPASGFCRAQQTSCAYENLAEQRPEQQAESQRGDRADETVGP